MSFCIPPATLSPGYLRLDYLQSAQSLPHSCRTRMVSGSDPLDATHWLAQADQWAGVWQRIVTNAFTCASFSVLDDLGRLLYTAPLSITYVGTHSAASGALDYASRTVCFTGHAPPSAIGQCSGEALHRVFVGAAFEYIPRQKFIVPGADGGVDLYASFLDTNSDLFCDYYGRHAFTRGRYPVQFNAAAQRRNGT